MAVNRPWPVGRHLGCQQRVQLGWCRCRLCRGSRIEIKRSPRHFDVDDWNLGCWLDRGGCTRCICVSRCTKDIAWPTAPPPNPWAVGGWLVVLLLLLTSIPDWYLTTTTSLWPHYYPPLLGSTRTCSTTPPPTQPQVDDTFVSWADRNICILIYTVYIYLYYIHKCRHVESNVFRTYHLLHGFAEVDSVHLIIFDHPYAT